MPLTKRTTHPTLRRAFLAVLLLAALSVAFACAINPATGQRQLALMSVQQEIQMGEQAHQEVLASMGPYDDAELQAYVDRIGQSLAAASERPDLPWTFTVIDDPSVNAFALPGGHIYLTRGILGHMRSEAEMVSVLGHEIGHVTARHSVERLSKAQLANLGLLAGMIVSPEVRQYGDLAQTGLGVLFLKFSRDDERQADDLGFRYMNRAGYDPHEMVEMFRVLDRVSARGGGGRLPDWLATHPNPEDRLERIERSIGAALPGRLGSTVEREAFLQRLDGVVFGPDPREGFFEGTTFHHPELAFTIRFPEGWTTQNRKDAVLGVSPEEDAVVALTLAQDEAGGANPDRAIRSFFSETAVRSGASWRSSIGGFPAASRFFTVSREAEDLAGLVAFVRDDERLYRLIGYTAEGRVGRYRSALTTAVGSLERLRDRRYLDVQPRRIELVRLDREMTLREIDRRHPSTVELETLAIINHVEAEGATLPESTLYKRVVGGELPGD